MIQYCLSMLRWLLGKRTIITESSFLKEPPIVQEEPPITQICQLCSQDEYLVTLNCKHIICYGCLETQKLYTMKPCFICEDKNWSKPPYTFF
jgi:hypothetical protein